MTNQPTKTMNNKSYWNERFQTETQYDWFASYDVIRPLIEPHLIAASKRYNGAQPSILILGCGTSTLSSDLYQSGYCDVTSVDYSEVVIEKMRKKHPELTWKVVDVHDLSAFQSNSFDIVIEKALIDIFLVGVKNQWRLKTEKAAELAGICSDVSRILKPTGGVFISVTFSPPHFRKMVYASSRFGWSVDVNSMEGERGCLEFYVYVMRTGEKLSVKDQQFEDELKRKEDDTVEVEDVELEENDILNMNF